MACEVPCLVTDYTTTQEIILDNKAGEGIKLSGTEYVDMFKEGQENYDMKKMNGTLTGSWDVERGICDVHDAAEKIIKWYNNPELLREYGKNGRKAVLEHYDFDKNVGEVWEKKILEICNAQ